MPKAYVAHAISRQGTDISTLDHSATIPRAKYKVTSSHTSKENGNMPTWQFGYE